MQAIKRNIVGLVKFSGLMFTLILPRRPEKLQERQEQERQERLKYKREYDKYMNLIKQPSVPLVPTETVFCPQCHVLVCQLARTKEGIQIIQNGRVRVTVGGNITTSRNGKKETGFPMRCPNGHIVRIE